MRRFTRPLRLVLIVCWLAPLPAVAALSCRLTPEHPAPGQSLTLEIDGAPLPVLRAADFAKDWRVLSQGESSFTDARGQSWRSLNITLLPLHAGAIALPATTGCPTLGVKLTPPPGGGSPQLSTRFDPARPMVGQPVSLQLVLSDGPGVVDWQDVTLLTPDAMLVPMPPQDLNVGGHAQHIWSWSLLPLRAGPIQLDFGSLIGSHFGQALSFAVPSQTMLVRELPRYWSADLPVGVLRLRVQAVPATVRRGQELVLHGEIELAGFDATALARLLRQHVQAEGFELQAPRLRQTGSDGVVQRWRFDWPVRAQRSGSQLYPELKLPLLDAQRGAPTLVRAGWGRVEVINPWPRRLWLGALVAGALGLVCILWVLALPAARRAWRRARWLALRDGAALERAWRAQCGVRSARRWLLDQAAAGLPVGARHHAWLNQFECSHYRPTERERDCTASSDAPIV